MPRYCRRDHLLSEEFDGDVLVLNPETSAVVVLNPSAALLFGALRWQQSEADLERLLLDARPDLEAGQVRQHVMDLLATLRSGGLVEQVCDESRADEN